MLKVKAPHSNILIMAFVIFSIGYILFSIGCILRGTWIYTQNQRQIHHDALDHVVVVSVFRSENSGVTGVVRDILENDPGKIELYRQTARTFAELGGNKVTIRVIPKR